MIGIVVLSVAVVLLVAFVLGIVTGVHIACGRALPWRARSRQAVTAEALTAQLATLRAELAARPNPHPAHITSAAITTAPEGSTWVRPPGVERRSIEGGDHT